MEKPKVERIDGLSPTLCIDQKTVNRNPRSTVGTVTEILDHLRLLMARLGTPHCPSCDRALSRTSPGELADRLIRDQPEAWITVMAPIVQERKGEYRKELAEAQAQGWVRARIDGQLHRLDEAPTLGRYEKHSIELVVDRLRARPENRSRMAEAMEQAVARAGGGLSLLVRGPEAEADEHQLISMARTCPEHGITAAELEPRLFSFNAPQGACPACSGLGTRMSVDEDLLIGDDELSLADGVIIPWSSQGKSLYNYYEKLLNGLARDLDFDLNTPWRDLPDEIRQAVLSGNDFNVKVRWKNRYGREVAYSSGFEGVIPYIERQYLQA
jgi:excinuclease ABC subunit A